MTDVSGTTLWHTFSVRDADAMMTWLRAVGFTEHATYRDEQDASAVVHRGNRPGGRLPRHGRPGRPVRGRGHGRSHGRPADGGPGLRRPGRQRHRPGRQPLVVRQLSAELSGHGAYGRRTPAPDGRDADLGFLPWQ